MKRTTVTCYVCCCLLPAACPRRHESNLASRIDVVQLAVLSAESREHVVRRPPPPPAPSSRYKTGHRARKTPPSMLTRVRKPVLSLSVFASLSVAADKCPVRKTRPATIPYPSTELRSLMFCTPSKTKGSRPLETSAAAAVAEHFKVRAPPPLPRPPSLLLPPPLQPPHFLKFPSEGDDDAAAFRRENKDEPRSRPCRSCTDKR